MEQLSLFPEANGVEENRKEMTNIPYRWVQGGNVPGGHEVFYNEGKKPFITPMRECNSIELEYTDRVADIGAYVGTYALRCARFPVYSVRAYEPSPLSLKVLKEALAPPNLEIIERAVTNKDNDLLSFYISHGLGVTNSLLEKKRGFRIEVDTISYREAVKGCSIVKVDIEGGEYMLPPDEFTIDPHIRAIIFDFHPVGRDWIEKAEGIIDHIQGAGFNPVIKPDWENGWTRAGSWIREHGYKKLEKKPEELISGKLCCCCGVEIESRGRNKSICEACSDLFTKKHRANYSIGRRRA